MALPVIDISSPAAAAPEIERACRRTGFFYVTGHGVPAALRAELDALSREFVLAVDDYVEVLRGDPPTPAAPWSIDTVRLAAADQQLRDTATHIASDDSAARVLVAEVGAITRSLAGITVDARDAATS